MRRLRHPIRAIREPFGTAGLIVACIALVAALGGTAFAAAKLNSTQKKEVEKIAKKYAGKPGTNGTNGTNGSPGAKGDTGAAGSNGSNGTNGESVKVTEIPNGTEGKCTGSGATGKGGAKFEVGASKAYACNGKEGSPWTAGGTLPSGKTETGVWGFQAAERGIAFISFPIPLSAPLHFSALGCSENPVAASCQVHFINGKGNEVNAEGEEVTPLPQCPGTGPEPKAEPGNLCVYAATDPNNTYGTATDELFGAPGSATQSGTGTTGTSLEAHTGAQGVARGTWAVTAP